MYFDLERIKRLLKELGENVYVSKKEIADYKFKACSYGEYILLNEEPDSWDTFEKGQRYGGRDKHFWFKTTIEMPEEFQGKPVVYVVSTGREGQWDALNPQFLAYVNKKITQGLDVNHREILLTDCAKKGESFDIALYAYSGMIESSVELNTYIAVLERETEKLYYNIKVPIDIAELLEEEDKKRIDILKYMTEAVNMLDLRKHFNESYFNSIREANNYLQKEFYEKFCGSEEITEICVGHTHIDVAWLWTLAQTREKAVRSFSTVLNLMKQYPEYIFMSSQPQLYQFVKEDAPEVYEEIKQRIKEGRWEAEGAMWLEADTNLTSGESLIRQIMYGKNFFKKEFDINSEMLWLPDVFGYSAALPQILKKSGVNYFMTTKISWNEYNKMPYDSFMWTGIDGTEVLTHFISTTEYARDGKPPRYATYNGELTASQVMGTWQRYQQKAISSEVLSCFGYGDGGGGATKEMIERAKRFETGIPGSPKVKIGRSLDFFKRLEEKSRENRRFPKWVGELYLEYHRGTYTSMARNKKFNRKTEFLNMQAELTSVMKNVLTINKNYPAEKLSKIWETTLLNQFHDIIPGSSIKEVYEDSKAQYVQINKEAEEIIGNASSNIASNINLNEISVVVFNSTGFERNDIVEFNLPEGWGGIVVLDGDRELPAQIIEGDKVIFFGEGIPAKGYKAFIIRDSARATLISPVEINEKKISNKFFDISFDDRAAITSIFDKMNKRQVLKEGERGNVLQAFEDKPYNFDAWDINIYYQEKMWEVDEIESIEVVEKGPVRAALKITRKFLDSKIIQNIYVYNDMDRIDFETRIDWKENQILLKAAFPVDIHTDKAVYDIQYGNVERPTHWNTSWDYAKFEVCAHKWADVSEDGYGVSLLNDCKYGHEIKESVMKLTLLKSAMDPNPEADKELHEFTYSLYPHTGDWKQGKVVNMAYNLNSPLVTVVEEAHVGNLPDKLSLFKLDAENVIMEVVKKAESSDDIILRVYECYNRRTAVNCLSFAPIKAAAECDLLENDLSQVSVEENSFNFEIKPYEIKTFKIKLQ